MRIRICVSSSVCVLLTLVSVCFLVCSCESCALCPVRTGAMKRTTDFQWAHLVCAQWIPEVFFRLPEGREPIDILMTPLRRHTQTCIYCHQACGVCVECSDSTCKKWFHITCGQRNEIFLEYTQKNNGADVIVSYCKEHGKKWTKKNNVKSIVRASK
jgi:NuA3 HAT complex component NTO1